MTDRKTRRAQAQAIWSDTPWEDIATFIGPNADKFRLAWEKQRALILKKGYGQPWTFCWPALFFSFVWFFYRKQWAIGAVMIILPVALGVLFPSATGSLGGIAIAFAGMAKGFYLQNAIPKIASITAANPDPAARDTALKTAGGTSIPAAILSGILLAAATMAGIISLAR